MGPTSANKVGPVGEDVSNGDIGGAGLLGREVGSNLETGKGVSRKARVHLHVFAARA